ncbi:MAG: hypothetical protein ACRD1P_11795 [Thermoanaerobaculia bacterium]
MSYRPEDLKALRLCNLLLQTGDRQAVRTLVVLLDAPLALKNGQPASALGRFAKIKDRIKVLFANPAFLTGISAGGRRGAGFSGQDTTCCSLGLSAPGRGFFQR